MRQISRKYGRASVNPEVGIGVPIAKADTPPLKRFFCVRSMASPLWAGRVGLRKQRRSLARYANLHGSALPDWRRVGGDSNLAKDIVMTKRRVLTLNPSRARAAYHRACALASLHSNSSLSVRLARYNHHMHAFRALAQQGASNTVGKGGDV